MKIVNNSRGVFRTESTSKMKLFEKSIFCCPLFQPFNIYRKSSILDFRLRSTSLELLTLSWRRALSYRNQPIDLQSKSMDWFLYDNGLRHERVNYFHKRLHLDVWLGSKYVSDMFKERQKLKKTFKGVIFRNTAAK